MKILVVDDSLFMQITISKMLEESFPGAQIITAKDGAEGLQVYRQERPDLIVADLLMPVMSGFDMIKTIRETDEETKIVVISSDVQTAVREEVAALKVQGFISKPLNEEKKEQIINIVRVF